jgi:hypothetical protein
LTTNPSNTTSSGLSIPAGTAPSAPANGDIWTTTVGAFVQVSGTTRSIVDTSSTQALTNKTYNGLNVPATTGTLTLANGKTLTANNSMTLGSGDGAALAITAAKTLTVNNSMTLGNGDGAVLAIAAAKTLTASNTLSFNGTDGSTVALGGGGTVTYTIASGALALSTSTINSGACLQQTATATGVNTADAIAAAFSADPTGTIGYQASTNGMLTIVLWPTANTVNVKVCNNTSAAITPGAVTLNWRVTR